MTPVNDLPSVVTCTCKLFADDTKIYRQVSTPEDCRILQEDLAKLDQWSAKWLMPFNNNKCKSLHLGSNNNKSSYLLGGSHISQVRHEKDLGVIIDNQLKFHDHTSAAINKATSILAIIRKSFALLAGP